MSKQDSIKQKGEVTEALGNSQFRVKLDIMAGSDETILAQLCGKMRKNYIKVIPGDRVEVEMSPYDLSRGRIVTRL